MQNSLDTTVRPQRTRHALRAVLMRAGTSKGLFIHRNTLPEHQTEWAAPLLAAMGSASPDPKQLDGIGGATSTTSKVAVVSPSLIPGVDVDYTFAQIAVGKAAVDYSGNCGNMASGVAPFAIQEGLVKPKHGQRTMTVRIFNTNTSRLIDETVELDEHGDFQEAGSFELPGVPGKGSEIKVAFVDPAGSMTSKLFPTGRRSETMSVLATDSIYGAFSVRTSLVDAANPFVFVDALTLPPFMRNIAPDAPAFLDGIEAIRRAGAVKMGLAPDTKAAAAVRGTPKIAVLSPPADPVVIDKGYRIRVQSFSMGKPHPSLQLTGAACLAAAVSIEGTIAHEISMRSVTYGLMPSPERTPERTPSPVTEGSTDIDVDDDCFNPAKVEHKKVTISHSSGAISVGVSLSKVGMDTHVDSCDVSRTARRLFEGNVLYYS